MEGVYHVHIVEVGCGSLIGDVHRVFEGEVPHGEGLKLSITSAYAPLMLVVELTETDSHLSAARSGGGDDDQRA